MCLPLPSTLCLPLLKMRYSKFQNQAFSETLFFPKSMYYDTMYLRQPSSSLPSLQSSIPSHLYVSCTHCRRSAHLNCVAEQVIGGQPSSSWLSKQSLSPSHTQDCGIQWPERGHVNWTQANHLVSFIKQQLLGYLKKDIASLPEQEWTRYTLT